MHSAAHNESSSMNVNLEHLSLLRRKLSPAAVQADPGLVSLFSEMLKASDADLLAQYEANQPAANCLRHDLDVGGISADERVTMNRFACIELALAERLDALAEQVQHAPAVIGEVLAHLDPAPSAHGALLKRLAQRLFSVTAGLDVQWSTLVVEMQSAATAAKAQLAAHMIRSLAHAHTMV